MRKPAPPKDIPPPLEFECLRILWKLGEGSVHAVRAEFPPSRGLAYTTIMTVLDRLEKRGAAARRKSGRSFVYSPKVSRDALRRVAVQDLLANYFDGDAESLRAYLNSPQPTTFQPVSDNLDAALL